MALGRVVLAAGAVMAIGGVVWLADSGGGPPARCAPGMVPLGPRCCGEGQRLEAGRCVGAPLRCASGLSPTQQGCVAPPVVVRIPAGTLRLGPSDWEAQGIAVARQRYVPSFSLDAYEVTEVRYAACVTAGSCATLPMHGEPGLPMAGATLDEAIRFCAFAGGTLPSADQLAFAAAGPSSRRYPWGDAGAVCRRVAFALRDGPCARGATTPEIAGSHPDGAALYDGARIFDLAGNVAEWTLPEADGAASAEVRGGSWVDASAAALRTWNRRLIPVSSRAPDLGFRCAYP